MKESVKKLEALMEIGGIKKDICFLVISGIALIISIFKLIPLPFDAAWVAIILCGIPIIMEAVIGLITSFMQFVRHLFADRINAHGYTVRLILVETDC